MAVVGWGGPPDLEGPRCEHRRVMKYPQTFSRLCRQAAENDPVLRSLDLRGFQLGPDGARELAAALSSNSNLLELNLWVNHIGDRGLEPLCQALQRHGSLAKLDLFNNDLGDRAAAALGELLGCSGSLTELGLRGNNISCAGAAALARGLERNSRLLVLDLSDNQVGEQGMAGLGRAMAGNRTLKQLLFDGNPGSAAGDAVEAGLERNQQALYEAEVERLSDQMIQDEQLPIHSGSQRADLRTLADCAHADLGILHTELILDLVDKPSSRVDKTPAHQMIRKPVVSELTVCDVSQRVLHQAASPININKD